MGKKKKSQASLADFKYVDAFHLNPQTEKRTKWIRMELDKVEDFRNKWNNYNVFTTVQRYKNKVRQDGGGEVMYAPLFFDIDSARTLVRDAGKEPRKPGLLEEGWIKPEELLPVIPQKYQAHIKNYALGIDIPDAIAIELNKLAKSAELYDLVWHKNLELAQEDIKKLIHFFTESFGMSEDEVRVYFSGSKGFHVLIDPIALGIEPDKDLHRIFKYIALGLEEQLKLRSLDSGSIYGHGRMFRLINSVHHKSGLFKVELNHDEVAGSIEDILALAKSPRQDLYPPDIVELRLNEEANKWYLKKVAEWQDAQRLEYEKTIIKDEVLSSMDGVPACVDFVLEHGILKAGDRNKATMALASYYKDVGYPLGETIALLTSWAQTIPRSLTSSTPAEVRSSTISAIKTVYSDDKYHFGCAYIRSLHGERVPGKDYETIPCGGRQCPAHEDYIIDQEPAKFMHLAETAKAEYTGQKVAFNALVSGKMDTPYIVPKKLRYICNHEKYCDKECLMHYYDGMYEKEFHENDRFLIEATNQNDNNLKGILRSHSGASCNKVHAEILEHINVTELLVVPMAERVKSVVTEEGHRDIDESGNEYVTRKTYAIGDGISANDYYEIEGYVYSHPRNATATILSQKHTPLEDSISQFELTDEIIADFTVFQKQEGETLDDRVSLIIQDLVDNVTLVRERFEAHLGILLTYHSCLHYYFQNTLEKRGWLETIIIGDSGQAKSMLVNNIVEFCSLGNMTSGEGSSRTGLVYRLEQMGERWFITWGQYPLSDRRLIVIDEFSELDPADFGKITEARTTGVLRVDRVVNTETNARVRLILLSNPVRSRTLSSYSHGVEALKPLFHSPADIRRLDLAIFMQSGDVSNEVLNAEYTAPEQQLISAKALRNSILWAWSRTPEQIDITKPAMRMILKKAEELSIKYGYARDIPLLEPADLRKKLARISIALAGLVHSTDKAHEKIIVEPEHVEYVVDFLTVIYDNKNARFDIYSMKAKEESELTEEERVAIEKKLDDLDFGAHTPISAEIIELFRRNDILKPQEIIDMLGYERGQVNARLAIMTKHSMIKRTREGLRKLPKFIEFLNN